MNNLKDIIFYGSFIMIILLVICSIIIRFANPGLTETQLFLKSWWVIVCLLACLLGINYGSKQN